MEITLEKIELVKDRTGATYKEAKEALEANDGSVVDAIVAIEETINKDYDEYSEPLKDNKIIEKAKAIIAKGNVSRIIVRKDDEVFVNFPLTVSVVGVVLVPWGVIFGAIAAVGLNCAIEFVNDKGEILDINGAVVGVYDKAKVASKKVYDEIAGEGKAADKISDWLAAKSDKFDEIRNSEKVSDLVDKGVELTNAAKDKFSELNLREKLESLNIKESLEELKDQAEAAIKNATEEEEFPISDENTVDIEDVINEVENTEE